jgi:hypothetical protein
LGVFDSLWRLPVFKPLKGLAVPACATRNRGWWLRFAMSAGIPALLFFPAFVAIYVLVPPSSFLPQMVTTQVTFWALLCAGVALVIKRFTGWVPAKGLAPWMLSIMIAALTAAAAYSVFMISNALFNTDLRFWIVALKLPNFNQLTTALIYVVPLTLAYVLTLRTLCHELTVKGDTPATMYISAIMSLTLGFMLFFGSVYAGFFATGYLVTSFDPLSTVIALQFIPILAAIAIIGIFTWRRTGSHRPGAVLVGILVTLYVVAGTATQVA